MDLSVAILAYECRDALLDCLASVESAVPPGTEVIVADNASGDGGLAAAKERFPAVRPLPMEANLGYAVAMNRAVAAARGEAVLLLNADVRVPPGGVDALLAHLRSEASAGAVAPPIVGPTGRPRLNWGRPPGLLSELARRVLHRATERGAPWATARVGRVRGPRRVAWASAAVLLVRRSAFEAVGGLDEGFFLYFEDIDLCLRMGGAGWMTWLTEGPPFMHEGGISAACASHLATEAYRRSQLRFFRKHRGRLATAVVRLLVATRLAMVALFDPRAGFVAREGDTPSAGDRAFVLGLAGRVLRGMP